MSWCLDIPSPTKKRFFEITPQQKKWAWILTRWLWTWWGVGGHISSFAPPFAIFDVRTHNCERRRTLRIRYRTMTHRRWALSDERRDSLRDEFDTTGALSFPAPMNFVRNLLCRKWTWSEIIFPPRAFPTKFFSDKSHRCHHFHFKWSVFSDITFFPSEVTIIAILFAWIKALSDTCELQQKSTKCRIRSRLFGYLGQWCTKKSYLFVEMARRDREIPHFPIEFSRRISQVHKYADICTRSHLRSKSKQLILSKIKNPQQSRSNSTLHVLNSITSENSHNLGEIFLGRNILFGRKI